MGFLCSFGRTDFIRACCGGFRSRRMRIGVPGDLGVCQQVYGPNVFLVPWGWLLYHTRLRPVLPCSLLALILHAEAMNSARPPTRRRYLAFA